MPFALRKIFAWHRPRVSLEHRKTANDIQLVRSLKEGPTPISVVNAFGLELAEEKAKQTRLGHERRRIKAEVDAFAEEKRKLEDEIRQVKGSLEAREKELAHKDANLRRLERDMSEAQTKVSRVEGGMDAIADMFGTTPPEACRVAKSGRTRPKTIRAVGRNGKVAFGEDNGTERCTGVPHQGRRRFRGGSGGYDRKPEYPHQLCLRRSFGRLGPTRACVGDTLRRA